MDDFINNCIRKGYKIPEKLVALECAERHLLLADIKEWIYIKFNIYLSVCPKVYFKIDRKNENAVLCKNGGWLINLILFDTYKEYKGLNEWSKNVYDTELKALEMGIIQALEYV